MPVWSSTDFAYQCLRDERRTGAYRSAIERVVRRGDVVLDAGAGTGILALFAARAGARRVYAVELDRSLATALRRTVELNHLSDVVEVIEADATQLDLAEPVDVFVADLIDTGLLDEMQVPVANSLRARGVTTANTRLIPRGYRTSVEIGYCDWSYYGFSILAPRHDWPHLAIGRTGWSQSEFRPLGGPYTIQTLDFSRAVNPAFSVMLEVEPLRSGLANALRLSGQAQLASDVWLGATNAINGDKVLPLEPLLLRRGRREVLSVSGIMGAGLETLTAGWDRSEQRGVVASHCPEHGNRPVDRHAW